MVVKLDSATPQSAENLLREQCSNMLPEKTLKYYLLIDCEDGVITYHSIGVSWENDVETRAPRLVNGVAIASYYREKGRTITVLHSALEFESWFHKWGGLALVERSVWLRCNSSD
jgi:hypothetical protein